MSLLEKAAQHKESSSQNKGLLGRAERFREDSYNNPEASPGFQKSGLLKKAERIVEEDKKLEFEELSNIDSLENEFDLWEKEAREVSAKSPIQPQEKDSIRTDDDYLFDDESDFTTAPIEFHLASKRKIENYHSIFEITKELAVSSDFASFFSNLNYSIVGQVGVETFAVFSNTGDSYETLYLLEYQGFKPEGEWIYTESDYIYAMLKKADSVIYYGELLSMDIPLKEKAYLEGMGCEILAPIRDRENFFGFLALGKLLNGEEYISDDLEFIKVVCDIAGSVFQRIREFEVKNKEIQDIRQELNFKNSVLDFSRSIASIRRFDLLYDVFIDTLSDQFGLEKFTLLVFDPLTKDEYKVFSSNQLSPESSENFRLRRNSDIVGMISNVSGFYEMESFRKNPEILSLLTNDEIGIMNEFTLVPIINLNWLVCILIIHKTRYAWLGHDRETILRLIEISAPVFANVLILNEKENIFSHPFSPLEDRLISEFLKAEKLSNPFTVVVFKVQNSSRMIQLLGELYFANYCDRLRKEIQNHLGENDHFLRVGSGKFAAILHGKDKEETEIVIKKIKADFQPDLPEEKTQFRPSYRILSLSYPEDSKDKSQFLEMVEEA